MKSDWGLKVEGDRRKDMGGLEEGQDSLIDWGLTAHSAQ